MAFKTRRPKNCALILGEEDEDGVNFAAQAKSITLTPDRDSGVDIGLTPDARHPYADDPSWTLTIGYFEGTDTDLAKVLGNYLFAHDGEIVPFVFRPDAADEMNGQKGQVMILTGGFGAEQGSTSEQSVDLPVQGQPEFLDGTVMGSGAVGAPTPPAG